ncbi:WD repeat-containing protein 18 isoform X1 [Hippocampus zosterae]|uniref:WD repeat-containing protein 18 isoform X1 n=1 Tax=Hippocampus zosterae TaxID=109293 RepID=UPI00223DA557|nr:WD repeat-containing protein 18 isoform X1 [Hippocampus zosterae]
MSAPLEVVMSSDASSQLWNVSVFDVHSGSSLLSYRGGNSSARTLCLVNGQYLLSAQLAKNFINVWEIHRKEQLQQKIVCPGAVTCISASADGVFLAAGVGEAIYLWEVSTGKLLYVVTRHYQDVTCVKFTDDGSHFVSGGKDSVVLVWSLSSVIQVDLSYAPEPRHILSHHSLPITDLHCGMMGAQARVATASLDQTVKLWEVSSGELLLSVLFDVEIMSVTLDPCEHFLFCGGSDGNIFQVSLCTQQGASADKSFQCEGEGKRTFKGHRKMVTCLSVSMDGTLLVSGSHDESVRLWDVQSKQCVRCFAHKGPVTNASIVVAPANMFLPDSRPSVPLPRFSRHQLESDGGQSGEACVRLGLYAQEEEPAYLQKADRLDALMNSVSDKWLLGDGENSKARVAELEEEVQTLKKVNKDLYDFSSQLLTKAT